MELNQIVCLKVTPKLDQLKFDEAKKTMIREGVENEINEADKNALEMALNLKESFGGTVTVLSMGPPSFDAYLKLAVAMGADNAILVSDRAFGGADTYATSLVLSAAIKKIADYQIVLCSEASSDGSTEQVPPSLAEWLGIPLISYVNNVELKNGNGFLRARRNIRGGYEIVEAPLPALLSIELGCNSPRFPDFRRKRWAEKEFKTTVWNINDLKVDPSQVGLEGSMTSVNELRSMRSPQRKREFISGDTKQIVSKLAEIIRAEAG
jgi:electron transfer flavoprotein beta subunit